MEHLQRLRHTSGERLPFWTHGSVPIGDLLMLQLLRPVFPYMLCLFPIFHPEHLSVLSRFCLLQFKKGEGGLKCMLRILMNVNHFTRKGSYIESSNFVVDGKYGCFCTR